jgi:hypothetical protein
VAAGEDGGVSQLGFELRLTNDFGAYLLRDPEVIESALFGPCLRGWFRLEGSEREDYGDFRLDRATVELALETSEKHDDPAGARLTAEAAGPVPTRATRSEVQGGSQSATRVAVRSEAQDQA